VSAQVTARRLAVGARLRERLPWNALTPVLVSAGMCIVALIVRPRTVDSAAHVYRAELFRDHGFVLWNNNWYGGHHSPAYSLLFPPVAALLGPLLVGAIEAVVSTALFERLVRNRWGAEASRWGAIFFGLGSSTFIFTGRLTFGFGVMFGIAAALAEQHRRRVLAGVLAAACSLASPVAGLFLVIAAAAYFVGGERRGALVLGLAALLPALAITYTFPEGGHEPFDFSTFWPLLLWLAGFILVVPRHERVVRICAAIYLVAGVAWYFVDTPMGGNAIRFGAIVGGPVLACVAAANWPVPGRRRQAIIALLVLFAFWQWSPAVRDTKKGLEDPATRASYYRPLLDELHRRGAELERIEIPFTRSHWEAAEVAPEFALARGWQRQLDLKRNPLFYDGGILNATTYGTWLAQHGVGYVALANAKTDYSGHKERALVESGVPYLREIWSSENWRLYRVTLPHAMVVPEGDARMTLTKLPTDSFVLDVQVPGSALVKVQWSQYWQADEACVEPDGEWTRVIARRPGRLKVRMAFSPERIVSHGRRCA